ncbi:AraC family transcriptional regulator [Roseomonas elaeocarpi]|uniref:AraC family transcriptional regulator n=1 Tax=Roseomonas elaeocarpi TaxID=907779 RepID=A0ABV6JVD1_9PROT
MLVHPHSLTETPEMPPLDQPAPSPDLMSELLLGMRLRGIQYRRIQARPPFGLGFGARPGYAHFHFLATGTATLRTADGTLHDLRSGTAAFLPHAEAHQLLSAADAPVEDIANFSTAPLCDTVCAVDACTCPEAAPDTILFSGCMEFELGGMQSLVRLMPALMLVDALDSRHPGLMPILAAMEHEACAARVGFAGILARLADVVAAVIVRGWVESGCGTATGLVAALREPRLARAILALHRQPGRDWTVAELARESGTSRSVFAERFQATTGVPPLRYATELRMRLASQWLTEDRLPIEAVAGRLGYSSQAAFSRAFKRITGVPPGASRAGVAVGGV